MEQNETTIEAPAPQTTDELVRPQNGRMIAGVAQGLANRFDVPVWVPRALFVISAFFGGLGIVLYGAGWALMRSEEETESPAQRFFAHASTARSWIGIALVFLAVLLLLDNFTFVSGAIVWPLGLLVVGALLYRGDLPRLLGRSDDENGTEPAAAADTTNTATDTETPSESSPPAGGEPPTPTPPILRPRAEKPKEKSFLGRLTIGLMVLGAGILAVVANTTDLVQPEPRHYLALAVTILGLSLIVGAIAGRARWLILIGVILVPTLLFSPVFEWDWTSNGFNRTVVVRSFDELQNVYSIEVGRLEIDLTHLAWEGEEISVAARVDAGNIEVLVPHDVGITGTASVDIGRVAGPDGHSVSGLGDPNITFNIPGSDGNVDLDLTVDVGNIDVRVRG